MAKGAPKKAPAPAPKRLELPRGVLLGAHTLDQRRGLAGRAAGRGPSASPRRRFS
ncbi:MAG: hypothetical protein WDO13_01600 [Verrucomicrobiota bacterium]